MNVAFRERWFRRPVESNEVHPPLAREREQSQLLHDIKTMAAPFYPPTKVAALKINDTYEIAATVEVSVPATPGRREWARLLEELAHQIDDGRIYDRDLDELAAAISAVADACVRRPTFRGQRGRAFGWGDKGRRER